MRWRDGEQVSAAPFGISRVKGKIFGKRKCVLSTNPKTKRKGP